MRAIVFDRPGDESVLRIADVERPAMVGGAMRIRVHATAVNRADLLQRKGLYPPPPGASPILGLECAGEVIELAAGVEGWRKGDPVMALLSGGGYAEEAVVDVGSAIRVPDAFSWEEAAAMLEVFLTPDLNICELGHAKRGETLLLHGGGSGVGTAATTLAKLAGLRVIVTAGSKAKCDRCLAHGADIAINYREEDFAQRASGSDIILDPIGAQYLPRDLKALAVGGRVVLIGMMGGRGNVEIDVGSLLAKRQRIIGSHSRGRSKKEKASIVAGFVQRFGDDLRAG